MRFPTKIILLLFALYAAFFAAAQKDSILFKGFVFHKCDTTIVYIFTHEKIKRLDEESYDEKNLHSLKSSYCYLNRYLHEYEHAKADYIYTDKSGKIIALQENQVILLHKGRRHYLYHFKHAHKIIFLVDSVNGEKIRKKRYSYSFVRTVWAPPKF